ncbi:unnamed protein product [Ranitomeya imitator]|uniref:Reverse transcriptase domain-containing protein n=1 Tax=Ranitomeya imitator TaxID=111125 RepID=A0ABN9LIN4_9NEOB|nr:unnamed protein product [Ranitomeya imitator]
MNVSPIRESLLLILRQRANKDPDAAAILDLGLEQGGRDSIATGSVPQDWRIANVVPIFKKGSKSEPVNYRPVSLTSIVGKIFEGFLRDVILDYLNENNCLTPYQHGFMRNRSCQTNLISFYEEVSYRLDHVDHVRKRWRSVTDRFIKSLKTPSGSSPPRKRVPFADQLQFILGSRSLRRTESNVYAQTPPDLEGDTSEHNIGEEVEECRMASQDSSGTCLRLERHKTWQIPLEKWPFQLIRAKCQTLTMLLLPRTLHPALVVVSRGAWGWGLLLPVPWL